MVTAAPVVAVTGANGLVARGASRYIRTRLRKADELSVGVPGDGNTEAPTETALAEEVETSADRRRAALRLPGHTRPRRMRRQ
jgi:hypothetical protein